MRFPRLFLIGAFVFALALIPLQAQSSSSSQLSSADRQFLNQAASGDKAEIELGQLAQQKAQNDQVKMVGQHLVTDHQKSLDQAQKLADKKGISLNPTLAPSDQQTKAKLEKVSGAEFDREFVRHEVRDHRKDIAEYQQEARNGQDGDVKQFAEQSVPTLQSHLQMSQSAEQSVSKSAQR